MIASILSRTGRRAAAVAVAGGLTLAALSHLPTAFAHGVTAGDLVLEGAWTRATPDAADVAGGYLVIRNTGSSPDRLVGGTAAFSERVEIHEMAMDGDVMKMRPVAGGLEIPAGGEVVLKPGSFHVMFIGLTRGLEEGTEEEGTLVFEKAGTVEVEWTVEAMGAKDHGGMDHSQ
jgi:copper(I)-binding protein